MYSGNRNQTPMDVDDDTGINPQANQGFVRQGPMTLTQSFANMGLSGHPTPTQTTPVQPVITQQAAAIAPPTPAAVAPTRPVSSQGTRDQRNENMFLYSESGVCLGYYLGRDASIAMENLMLSGQLESVLLSLFPTTSGPPSRSSQTASSSASSTASSYPSSSTSGYQSSVSDVDQQKAEFARMVSKGDWNIDDAQRLLTDIHLLHRSEQQSNTRAQGNKRF